MTSLLGPLPNLLQLLAAPVPARPWCLELTFWDLEEQLCQQGVQGIQLPQPGIQPPQPGIQPPQLELMTNSSRSNTTTVGRTGVQIRPWAWEADRGRS